MQSDPIADQKRKKGCEIAWNFKSHREYECFIFKENIYSLRNAHHTDFCIYKMWSFHFCHASSI